MYWVQAFQEGHNKAGRVRAETIQHRSHFNLRGIKNKTAIPKMSLLLVIVANANTDTVRSHDTEAFLLCVDSPRTLCNLL